MSLPERNQTYSAYLGKTLDSVLAVRHCPVDRMTLCVTSDPEMEKCVKMKVNMDKSRFIVNKIEARK